MTKVTHSQSATSAPARRQRVSQGDVPRHPVAEAVRIAQVLEDHYGGQSATPLDVAESLGSTPASSWFRTLTGAAIAYGFTEGGSNSPEIKLTQLGQRAVAPTEEGGDAAALREAIMKPRVMNEFFTKYDGKKFPPDKIAMNVLRSLGVDARAAERTLTVIKESGQHVGILRELRGDLWVSLRSGRAGTGAAGDAPTQDDDIDLEADGGEAQGGDETPAHHPGLGNLPPAGPKPIFVGHGKNKAPAKKVVEMLESFGIPSKQAIYEANLGQPIPTKVKAVMKECGSAVLIFTKDEMFSDEAGNEVWRPSENVVYELGAASFAYDDRVVIFMEQGLVFPANFESIGHIEFEPGAIEAKTMEFMKELVGFKLLKLMPAG